MNYSQLNNEQVTSLINENMGLLVSLVKLFHPKNRNEHDELMQLALIGAWRGIKKYDPNRGTKLGTNIWNYSKWEICRHLNKENKKNVYYLLEDLDINESLKIDESLVDVIPDYLTERERQIIQLKLEGYTFNDIAKKLQLSRGWVSKLYHDILDKIQNANEKT